MRDPIGMHRIAIVARLYVLALFGVLAVMPMGLILYLDRFQDPSVLFMDHGFHVIAIAVATLEGLFVSYISWRCYQKSGEPFIRWLTLGFLGFTVVYAPHGQVGRVSRRGAVTARSRAAAS